MYSAQNKNTINHPTPFLLALLGAAAVIFFINILLHHDASLNPRSILFNRLYVLLVGLPFLLIAYLNKSSWSLLGFTTHKWKQAVLEGFFISLALLPVLLLIKTSLHTPFTPPSAYAYTYFTSVIYQQSIRTCFQNYVITMLGAANPLWSCLITGLMFGLIHTHFGLTAMFLTFLIGAFFSLIYLRHHNIYGLIIMHNILGIAAFSFNLL